MSNQSTGATVRRAVTVDAPIERAFNVFTEQMETWWPHDTHQVGPTPADAVIEPFEGGRCYAMREQVDSAGGWGLLLDRYAAVLLPSLEATPGSSA